MASSPRTPPAQGGGDTTLGEAAESGNAAENRDGVSDKDPKTLKREGEKALQEVRKAELPKSFDD